MHTRNLNHMYLGEIIVTAEDGKVVASALGKTFVVDTYGDDQTDELASLYAWQHMAAGQFNKEMEDMMAKVIKSRIVDDVVIEEIPERPITAVVDGVQVEAQDIKANVAPVMEKAPARKPGTKIGLGKK